MSEFLHFQCVLMIWKRKTLSMSSLLMSDVLGLILTNCWPHLSPCVGKQLTVLLHTQIAQHACVLKHTANNELLILVQAQPIRSKHQGMVTY